MVDKNTQEKMSLSFAKLLVKVQLGKNLSEVVQFKNEKGKIVEQHVTYDWKPSMCKICHKYGHSDANCRKNKIKNPKASTTFEVEREIDPNNTNPKTMQIRNTRKDERKAGTSKPQTIWKDQPIPISNSFQ